MAWALTTTTNISWVPDGASAMSVPSAQTLQVGPVSTQVAGTIASPPTTAQLNTAAVAAGAAISLLLQAQVGVIDAWSTGNP